MNKIFQLEIIKTLENKMKDMVRELNHALGVAFLWLVPDDDGDCLDEPIPKEPLKTIQDALLKSKKLMNEWDES